jgi:hypothetical protein
MTNSQKKVLILAFSLWLIWLIAIVVFGLSGSAGTLLAVIVAIINFWLIFVNFKQKQK